MNTKELEKERLQGQQPRERLSTADLARAGDTKRDRERERPADAALAERDPEATAPLLAPDISNEFRSRWTEVQTGFVDTPREAVERADELVAEAIKRLAQTFSDERSKLEAQWARSGDVSTEDLRIALQRYRSFFQRLLRL